MTDSPGLPARTPEPEEGEVTEVDSFSDDESSSSLFADFIELQRDEIELRRATLQVHQRELENTHAYGMEALKLQAADRHEARQDRRTARRERLILASLSALVLVGLLIYLLQTGRDQFAAELMKALLFLLTGGTGGYFFGKQQQGTGKAGS